MKNINNILKPVYNDLSNQKIYVLPETLKKHRYQGWMSNVYTIESSKGKLIIHLINPVKEHQKNRIWDKFSGLVKILTIHPNIPTSKIIYSGLVGKKFILVQFFIPGKRAGKRVLNSMVISDQWKIIKKNYIPKILKALAEIHSINLNGFGWPVLGKNYLEGKYKTWKSFIENDYLLWLREIRKTDRRLALSPNANLKNFFDSTVSKISYDGAAVLVHGDAINPSNILVKKNNEVAILDWEWLILADPAWEFCDLGWWSLIDIRKLEPYFKAAKTISHKDKIDFIDRIKLYIPLWLLWGTYMHADDKKPDVYIALRKLLLEKINVNYATSRKKG